VSPINDSTNRLIEILQGPEETEGPNQAAYRRPAAADALGCLGDPVAVPALVEALKDKNFVFSVRRGCAGKDKGSARGGTADSGFAGS